MPELPEVEVLVRYLQPLVQDKTIRRTEVRRARVIAPTTEADFEKELTGAKIIGLIRRGKYLVFALKPARGRQTKLLVGHLGMTGRMFVAWKKTALPKHVAVLFDFGKDRFVYEDFRYFGRLTLDHSALDKLGPEPLGKEFKAADFGRALKRFNQAIKVKLLDQSLVAGVGNIYASEALFRAGISPKLPARRLTDQQVRDLWKAIRAVLNDAVRRGSTIPLSFSEGTDGLFYFGSPEGSANFYEERLKVYDRYHQPCLRCGTPIERIVQAARSTFFCPHCQNVKGAAAKPRRNKKA